MCRKASFGSEDERHFVMIRHVCTDRRRWVGRDRRVGTYGFRQIQDDRRRRIVNFCRNVSKHTANINRLAEPDE
jgi:hypothetical protein